jgi:RNA polymerase sigma-70 factor (ECF subfamily)
VSEPAAPLDDAGQQLLGLYESALSYVYGYLLARCRRASLAEELTSETFLAAVDAVQGHRAPPPSTPWLIGIARHKLIDSWRRDMREERGLVALGAEQSQQLADPWDVQLDGIRARTTLDRLSAQHRAVLTLRYLDDLAVPRVADLMNRSVHATEALLVRAKAAFRRAYAEEEEKTADA